MSDAAVKFELVAPVDQINLPMAEIVEMRPQTVETSVSAQVEQDRLEQINWFHDTRRDALRYVKDGITPEANRSVAIWCTESIKELLKKPEGSKE